MSRTFKNFHLSHSNNVRQFANNKVNNEILSNSATMRPTISENALSKFVMGQLGSSNNP